MWMNSRQHQLSVDISVFGRFQAFRLAAEMDRLGILGRLYTSYPKAIRGVDPRRISNVRTLKALEHVVSNAVPEAMRPATWRFFSDRFDRYAAARIGQNGSSGRHVLHAWASYCLDTLRVAQAHGIRTFLESSCPHPAFKTQLLEEEADRVGVPYQSSRPWVDRVSAECERADRIVVPSRYTRDSFVRLGFPAGKLVTVPLGVDVDEIVPDPGLRAARRPFRVLMVGTDGLRKAAYDLLRAWQLLGLKNAELLIRCGVVGAAGRLLDQPGVRHLPPIGRAALVRLYQQASVFCFPSVDDGFGMVVLEAMAAGLPVIVTEHVGAGDLITDGVEGFVLPIRSPEALAEKILYFYRYPEAARQMGRNARRLAERFTWSRYGEAMRQAYLQ